MTLVIAALLLAAGATSIEVTVPGPAGALAGTLTLCSWLRARLR